MPASVPASVPASAARVSERKASSSEVGETSRSANGTARETISRTTASESVVSSSVRPPLPSVTDVTPGSAVQGAGVVGAQAHPAHVDHRADGVEGVVGEDPPAVDHDHALGERLHLLEVVAGEHHRPALGVEVADRLPQRVPGVDVETGGRLVQEHQARVPDERESHCQPSLLATGQATGLPPREVGEAEALQQLAGGHGPLVVPGDEVDHLAHPQQRRQPGLLRGVADPSAAHRVARVATEELDRARGGATQPEHQADQRGLPGAVGAEQPDQLAGGDVEADAVEGDGGVEGAADVDGARQDVGTGAVARSGGHDVVPPRRSRSVVRYCSKASRPARVSATKVTGVRPEWVLVTPT